MNLILIPVYNDWKSLNKLLLGINKLITYKNPTKVLVLDDFSSIKMKLDKKKFDNFKKIEILRISKNVGSQKAIAIGLNYLKKKKKDYDYITIMDGDGEDDPKEINNMLLQAKKNKDSIVVSCRRDRNENLFIKFLYKMHLLLTFLFTGNWISFGNFSCFYKKNLEKILNDKSVFNAYSSSIKKNSKITRTYAVRSQRFYGKSQVNFLFLFLHSLRIMGVFYKKVVFLSFIYLLIINFTLLEFTFFINFSIISLNILIAIAIYTSEAKFRYSYSLKKIK